MQSLLVGALFVASLAIILPITVHAQTPSSDFGPKGLAAAAKAGQTLTKEDCKVTPGASAIGGPSVIDATEDYAYKNGGSCELTYGNGKTENLNFSAGQIETTQKNAETGAVTRTTEADAGAGGGAFSASDAKGCGISQALNPFTWGDCIMNVVATFVLGFANFMLGIAGVLLNWVVVKTVFQFSTLVGNSEGLLTAWGILRDIGNLVLLFGFVLMGIGTILDTNKLPDKKAIPMLILFAILLNFSIFAAEAVIDTSNVLTSVLYSQANTDPCTTETCTINNGIAGHIMQSTGLSGIYGLKPADAGEGTKKFVVLIGLSLFSLIGTVVLFATALMLAFRAIVLTGLIILSPIGFAGMAIKPLEKMARRWWHTLIHQAFFAPILFLLLFVTLKVTEGFSSVSNNNSLAQALTGAGTSNMGIIMVFVLISGGLIASLMAAKQFGAMGADYAVKTAGNIVGGAAFGTGAFIGRRTIGAGSAALGRTIRSSEFGESRFGRTLAGVADSGAKANFDVRTTKAAGTIGKFTKIDLGKPNKTAAGGYAAVLKKETDAKAAYAKSFKMSDAQEEQKKALDAEKTTREAAKNTRTGQLDTRRKQLTEIDTTTKTGWKAREPELDKEIEGLESKASANAGGQEALRLDQEISSEKRRMQTLINSQDREAAEANIKKLQKQRDEYTDVEQKLAALRATKLSEQTKYNETIKRISDDIKKVDEEKERSEGEYSAAVSRINADLEPIDPKKRQERYAENLKKNWLTGGRSNKEAAKKIIADMKKSKTEIAAAALQKAVEDKSEDLGGNIASLTEAIAEENKERTDTDAKNGGAK